VAAVGSAPPGTAAFVDAVKTDYTAHSEAAADEGGSSSEEWATGDSKTGREHGRPCYAQENV